MSDCKEKYFLDFFSFSLLFSWSATPLLPMIGMSTLLTKNRVDKIRIKKSNEKWQDETIELNWINE